MTRLPGIVPISKKFEDASIIPISNTDLAAYLAMSNIKYEWAYENGRIVFLFDGGDATKKLMRRFSKKGDRLRSAFKRLNRFYQIIDRNSPQLFTDGQRWI